MAKHESIYAGVKPVAPYSPAIKNGNMLFLSGQIGLENGALVEGGVAAQAAVALNNLLALVSKAGLAAGDLVKVTVLLTSMEDYGAVNGVYKESLEAAGVSLFPAREAFAVVGLPLGALVEISAIAVKQV